ncbi:MAG: L,D-transpeptidase family protein [Bacteroidota bacterium]
MKSVNRFLCLAIFIVAGCAQQTVINKPNREIQPENGAFLGYAKDLPLEVIQQYLLTCVDTVKQLDQISPSHEKNLLHEVKDLYRYNDYSLIWTTLTAPNSDAKDLLNEIAECREHGLNPDHYLSDSLFAQFDNTYLYNQEIDILRLIQLDIKLSSAYMAYAHDLHYGQIDPILLGENWQLSKRYIELAPYMKGKTFKEAIKMVTPKSDEYKALQKKLQSYLALRNEGGWNTLPDTLYVNPGEAHEAIYLLRDRLFYSGDYNSKGLRTTSRSLMYDDDLQKSLSNFQRRHGLKDDGILNKETIDELNVPIEHRIDQIRINLERLKWIAEPESEKSIVVNIPDFKLTLYKKSKGIKSFKTIVGKRTSKTPILSDQIEYITFSPSWFVPDISFNRQVLPKAKKDPNYLEQLGFKLYARKDVKGESPIDANSVQWNNVDMINTKFKALHVPSSSDVTSGKIKFAMPNKEGLYICDAANPALFDFAFRPFNFSSISVENPELLARYLLDDKHWDINTIREHMKASKPESVSLTKKVGVNVVYLTAWVDTNGELQFRDDIYGYDQAHSALLKLEDERWNQR